MSATTIAPTNRAHALVRRCDARGRGVLHAAVLEPRGAALEWRSACGRWISAPQYVFHGEEAHRVLASHLETAPASVCAGCDRVGDALS